MRPFGISTSVATSAMLLLVLAATPAVVRGQVPPVRDPLVSVPRPPLRILGTFDETSGQPLAGVEVIETATGTSLLTSSTGSANLALIVPNGGEIRLRKIGFEEQTMTVSMSAKDTVPITILMKHVAELPAVVTKGASPKFLSPALRSFEERRKNHASGYFIPDSILRKEDNRSLGNVLVAHAPGATVKQVSSANFLLKSPRCSSGGQPDVYIDGVPLAHLEDQRCQVPRPRSRNAPPPDAREYPIDLNQFQVTDLAGIEFYPDNATMPVQFSRTAAGCGALFLWTRER
jgi:hypothetical protein